MYECTTLEFYPWKEEWGRSKKIWTTREELSAINLEIYAAQVERGQVKISCHQLDFTVDFLGGDLWIACQGIEVFDQGKKPLEGEELKKIAQSYWDNPS